MNFRLKAVALFVALSGVIALFLAVAAGASAAVSVPSLGTAASFAVLGHSTVTNTGPTILHGNLGVSPGTSITGFPPGKFTGKEHVADAVALQAQSDITTAYVDIAGRPCSHNLTGQDLGGKTLVAGVYCFSSSAQLTGQLTLSGQGVFIFQIRSTLTTASNASVLLINGASACNVFWQVGSSATLGTGTHFMGNILALASITAATGAEDVGGLYARTGAVTLDHNIIDVTKCGGSTSTPTPSPSPSPTPVTPGLPNTGSDPNA